MSKPNFSDQVEKIPINFMSNAEPYILVNIGSGVSILRVNGTQYTRIGGTSLGGSTFLALTQLLTSAKGFTESLKLAEEGDSTHVDMLVRDIYGYLFSSAIFTPPFGSNSTNHFKHAAGKGTTRKDFRPLWSLRHLVK